MPIHVFVDESKARGLVLAAAACRADEVTAYRKELRGLLLPGQERLHFNHESTARRRKIIGLIGQLDLSIGIYQVARDDKAGRQACLQAVVRDIAGTAHRLIIERDESTYDFDKRTLTAAFCRYGCRETLRFELLEPKADPLLWIPDAVAWCWVRGGTWRQRIAVNCQVREI
jgi:hypothetical protein